MTFPANFIGAHRPLGPGDIRAEAARLQCSIAIVHAFSDIESTGAGFLPTGEPKILFEAHQFHLLTGGRFDRVNPSISSPVWDRSLYGAGGVHQYARLRQAMALSRTEALESASWGRFQVMGFNHRLVGFAAVDDMIAAFCESEGAHLAAFGAYCEGCKLTRYLRSTPPDFVRLALGYNGAGQAANGYSTKLRAAYQHYLAAGEGVVPPLSPAAAYARADNPAALGQPYAGAAA